MKWAVPVGASGDILSPEMFSPQKYNFHQSEAKSADCIYLIFLQGLILAVLI